jgi:hypothetical protein
MLYDLKLTLDGLMTLAAGVIAFIAVMIQVRRSSHEVQRQLNAEKELRSDEQEREKRSLASALLLEIDHFYRGFLCRSLKLAQGATGKDVGSDMAFAIGISSPLDIYEGNTSKIGILGPEATTAVIRFYKMAWELTELWQRYVSCLKEGDPHQFSTPILTAIERQSLNLRFGALEACCWLLATTDLQSALTDICTIKDRYIIEGSAKSMNVPLHLPDALGPGTH